jgi:hypothetical protein
MTQDHLITPPPPHLLKKFSAQAREESNKRNGAGYLKTFATLCIEWAINCQATSNLSQIRSSEIQPPPGLLAESTPNPDFIEFQPTLVTVPESTLERVLIALEAGWESASDEHAEAITQYQERRPQRVKWYAEQVELITAAIHEVQRALGWLPI